MGFLEIYIAGALLTSFGVGLFNHEPDAMGVIVIALAWPIVSAGMIGGALRSIWKAIAKG